MHDTLYRLLGDAENVGGIDTYTLIKNHHISSSTIDKLRKNRPLNTTTINDLCRILDCRVEDVMEYVPSAEDQIL